MKDFYSDYTADELWLIKETEWARRLQNKREAQFTLGNGYMGSRGILEQIPPGTQPGLYIAGVYDKMGSQVDELVNLPNPINFRFTMEGQKLDVVAMDILEYKRTLNMKKAVLIQHSLFRDIKKRRYDYQSLRFISMQDRHIGGMQIVLTAIDEDCTLDINTGIDTSIANAPILSEGIKRHFRVRELGQQDNAGYLVVETFEKRHIIVFWSGFYYEVDGKRVFARDNVFKLRLKKGRPVVFTKIFYIGHFPYKQEHIRLKARTQKPFRKAFKSGLSVLLKEHIQAWARLWKRADIKISGTANLQQNLRFNIYHMLICGQLDNGASSIGARTLSGEGYRGHIFWDAEIFLLPFYLFTFPDIAKDMLLYRYRRLNKSRQLAEREGYKGAKFAWESASTGDEETPAWARDIDGSITRVHTHQMEHHITACVAYAFYKYYIVAKDEEFMENYGYEVLFETARFWASRVRWNKKSKKFDIPDIIGPDEFHLSVKNNAFTNMMAKWNLLTAYKIFNKLKAKTALYRAIKRRLYLKNKEAAQWKQIASSITSRIGKNNVIEQFDGYFRLKRMTLTKTDENGMPIIPKGWRTKDVARTQLIKQADVLMLLYLFDDVFSEKTKAANYRFYIERTVHGSSLSPAVHSVLACDAYDMQKAYMLFNVALRMDISNLFDNTAEGIHAACLGGTWQAAVFGFGGVRIKKEKLSVKPALPNTWRGMEFTLLFQGNHIHLRLTNNTVKIKVAAYHKRPLEITVFNRMYKIKPGRWFIFNRMQPGRMRIYYY